MQINELKPSRMWYYFAEICRIPRSSKKEDKIVEYLINFGKKHGLKAIKDSIGNVIIYKPATKGKEKLKTVILQSHLDMVCEKNADTKHDFDNDPIIPYIDGEWVKAKGTTLGADDGIGIAAQLAILESKDIEHGPIECLFTIDEETGLTGAFGLDTNVLEGRILLNLDSEDEGEIFIGCAGGIDTLIEYKIKKVNSDKKAKAFKVVVKGLKGGHSGDDINKGLANANKLLNRILWQGERTFSLRLAEFNGGNLRNAIAREAYAIIVIPDNKVEKFKKFVKISNKSFQDEYKKTEPNLEVLIESCKKPLKVLCKEIQTELLNAIYATPHGVMAMSADIANFVETSTNLASIKTKRNKVEITTSQRSSVSASKHDIANMLRATWELASAKVKHSDGYPGWTPNPHSEILEISKKSYIDIFGKEPKILAIHAGLECGVIGEKYPGMDMISFGPTIKGAHSPDERLNIETALKFWNFILEILNRIPEK